MFKSKPLSIDAIAGALEKALRYRLLNQPTEAESICRDVLNVRPNDQDATMALLLALTDQFGTESGVDLTKAQEVLADLTGDYEKAYYEGVVSERWGKALLHKGAPGSAAISWLGEAMRSFAKAEALSPSGNDDAILRWNACGRMIQRTESNQMLRIDTPKSDVFDDEVPQVSPPPRPT